MRYEGTSENHNKILSSATRMTIDYRHNTSFGLSLFLRAGASYNLMRQNERNVTHQWLPYIHTVIWHKINAKNKINLSGAWYSQLPFEQETSEAMQRQNELLWTTGNPDLKASDNRWVMLQYVFMPSNNFSAGAFVLYKNYAHSPVYQFSTAEGYDGVIKSLSDFNTFQFLQGGVTATLSLFRKTLSLNAYLQGKYESNDGLYHQHLYGLDGLAQATWYHRNISLRLFYSLPTVSLENGLGYKVKTPQQYGITFTYGIGNFSAQLKFNNWFTSHGQDMKTLDSPHYSYDGSIWNMDANRNLMLNLSYTFSYGRKVSRDNEISAQDSPSIN